MRKINPEKKIVVNFSISRSTIWDMRDIKEKTGESMSAVVDLLLKEYIKVKNSAKYNVNLSKIVEEVIQ